MPAILIARVALIASRVVAVAARGATRVARVGGRAAITGARLLARRRNLDEAEFGRRLIRLVRQGIRDGFRSFVRSGAGEDILSGNMAGLIAQTPVRTGELQAAWNYDVGFDRSARADGVILETFNGSLSTRSIAVRALSGQLNDPSRLASASFPTYTVNVAVGNNADHARFFPDLEAGAARVAGRSGQEIISALAARIRRSVNRIV